MQVFIVSAVETIMKVADLLPLDVLRMVDSGGQFLTFLRVGIAKNLMTNKLLQVTNIEFKNLDSFKTG